MKQTGITFLLLLFALVTLSSSGHAATILEESRDILDTVRSCGTPDNCHDKEVGKFSYAIENGKIKSVFVEQVGILGIGLVKARVIFRDDQYIDSMSLLVLGIPIKKSKFAYAFWDNGNVKTVLQDAELESGNQIEEKYFRNGMIQERIVTNKDSVETRRYSEDGRREYEEENAPEMSRVSEHIKDEKGNYVYGKLKIFNHETNETDEHEFMVRPWGECSVSRDPTTKQRQVVRIVKEEFYLGSLEGVEVQRRKIGDGDVQTEIVQRLDSKASIEECVSSFSNKWEKKTGRNRAGRT